MLKILLDTGNCGYPLAHIHLQPHKSLITLTDMILICIQCKEPIHATNLKKSRLISIIRKCVLYYITHDKNTCPILFINQRVCSSFADECFLNTNLSLVRVFVM